MISPFLTITFICYYYTDLEGLRRRTELVYKAAATSLLAEQDNMPRYLCTDTSFNV